MYEDMIWEFFPHLINSIKKDKLFSDITKEFRNYFFSELDSKINEESEEFLNLFDLESEHPFKGEFDINESGNKEKQNYENVIDNNNELNNYNNNNNI